MLTPAHRADLAASGLTEATIARAGLYSASEERVKALLGFGGCGAGLVFPYDERYARVKIDRPGPDGKRYRAPQGSGNRLYLRGVEPDVLTDTAYTLYITEGEKKSLAASQAGFPTVAVSGVWSWKVRLHGKSLDITDLDKVAWTKRRVVIVFDSDAEQKPPVAWAEHQLAITLRERGADVYVIRIPEGPKGEKRGWDDFLVEAGVDAFARLDMRSVLEGDGGVPTFLRVADLAEQYLLEASSPTARLKTGYPGLDGYLRGVAPGEVMTVLGRSGVGKTAFLLNLAGAMSERGQVPSLIFSLEQPGTQLFERMVSIDHGIAGRDIEALARIQDAAMLDKIMATCSKWEHVITVDRSCTLAQLDAMVGNAQKSGFWSQPLRLVFIDYLGMIGTEQRGKSYEAVSETAKEIKRLAKRHRVGIVLLCQVGREGESGGTPVTMTSARDSGVVEESADYLLGIWRPELDTALRDKDRATWESYAGLFKCRVLKNRGGPAPVTIDLRFETPSLRITEAA